MDDPVAALDDLSGRVEAAAREGALETERAVQLRAVEPLFELLGWDVRSTDVDPQVEVAGTPLDYVLSAGDARLVAVATTSPDAPLESGATVRAERAIEEGPVARGLATDGETIVLLAADDGTVYRETVPFAALSEYGDALGQFHRSVLVDATNESAERAAAAGRLAAERDAVVDAAASAVLDVTGPVAEDVVTRECERAIDAVLDDLGSADGRDGSGESDGATGPESASDPVAGRTSDDHPREASGTNGGGLEHRPKTDPGADGGEYVARFFGGSNSVGAVGTESPRATTTGSVRYLAENHGLLDAIRTPWRNPADRVVLRTDPDADGWHRLGVAGGDALFVGPVDDPAEARETVEALADAAGLRVMFQGDW